MQDPAEWKLTSPGGVRHKLIRQWGSFGREDASWNMEICIQSWDLTAFVNECFPAPFRMGAFVVYPRRFCPAGLPTLECKTVSVEEFTSGKPIDPFGAGVSLYTAEEYNATYEPYLRLSLTFGPSPSNDQEPDSDNPFTWLEISASESAEFMAKDVNHDVLWWDKDGMNEEPDENDPSISKIITSRETEWTCKWPQIPFDFFQDVLMDRMRAVMGRVNDAPMELFSNAPVDTILFLGYQKNNEYTWREGRSGTSPVQATLRFLEKNFMGRQKKIGSDPAVWQEVQVTHNHIWREGHGWQRLSVNWQVPYTAGNLNSIFTG